MTLEINEAFALVNPHAERETGTPSERTNLYGAGISLASTSRHRAAVRTLAHYAGAAAAAIDCRLNYWGTLKRHLADGVLAIAYQ